MNTMSRRTYKTAQRTAVLNYLKDNKSHPSIMDIYENVLKKMPTISIVTVYNTMDLLKKEGLVFELPMLHGEGRRFDANPMLHDHMICKSCDMIFDIDTHVDRSLLISDKQRRGFDISEICINVYGTCPTCQKGRTTDVN